MASVNAELPNSLNLPPHLSAQKYFLVCTLTVAAWDTLVLSPRTWRLIKTPGWPVLKVLFHFLRVFMPLEFVVVGKNVAGSLLLLLVAVVNFVLCSCRLFRHCLAPICEWYIYLLIPSSSFLSFQACQNFYLFEPICTAILLAATSGPLLRLISIVFIWRFLLLTVVHVIRIYAIFDKNRPILFAMSSLFAVQVVVMAICCGFYRCMSRSYCSFVALLIAFNPISLAVPLLDGQGCIAGPRHTWVGIYWIAPTLLYSLSVSISSLYAILILPECLNVHLSYSSVLLWCVPWNPFIRDHSVCGNWCSVMVSTCMG